MKSFKEHITEGKHTEGDNATYNAIAKHGFDTLMQAAGSVGSHKGNVRVYERRNAGELKSTLVGDHDHKSFAKPSRTSGSGHYFASHYSARPGHDVYTHVKLPKGHDLSDRKSVEDEIHKQNPHHKGTGHPASLAADIVKYHGKN